MAKTVTVMLDGNEHTITELRSRKNADWRARLEEPFEDLARMLEDGPEVEIADLKSIASLVRDGAGMLLRSTDTIHELLVEYAPELAEVIAEAYDSEIVAAFGKVLELAYPFGGVLSRLKQLGSQSG